MRYLVDTDWVIHHLHGAGRVTTRLDELRPEGVGMSIVSLAELYEGLSSPADPRGDEQGLLDVLVGVEVVDLDEETCRVFAGERARLRSAGMLIGDMDLLIGATALRHELTLLSNNRRHFERIEGLAIESL